MPPKWVYTAIVEVPASAATLRALSASRPSRSRSRTPAFTNDSFAFMVAMLP